LKQRKYFLAADILVVDDQPNNLSLLAAMLAGHGFHPRPAINGQIALNAAFGQPPDLILLDVRMAGMDGYEVCRRLKADARTRDIPVLFLSALESVDDKVKAFEAGGMDYITKPFQEMEVITRIQAHLALAEARRQATEQAALAERQRLGRELHDSVTQSLTSLGLYIKGWQWRVDRASQDEVRQWLDQLGGIAAQTLKELRLLLYQLEPAVEEEPDLESALRRRLDAVEQRAQVKARLEVKGKLSLPPGAAHELLAIIQEALNNSLKHACAAGVLIAIECQGRAVRVKVEDNGVGFSLAEAEAGGGMGIRTMRARAASLGGTLEIMTRPGSGTQVMVALPGEEASNG
jgi:two-component system, sensor histidine kinase and response regulator